MEGKSCWVGRPQSAAIALSSARPQRSRAAAVAGMERPDFISTLVPGRDRASSRSAAPAGMMCRGESSSVRLLPRAAATAQKLGTPGIIRVSKPRRRSSSST